jgi:hypothetical protein
MNSKRHGLLHSAKEKDLEKQEKEAYLQYVIRIAGRFCHTTCAWPKEICLLTSSVFICCDWL